MAKSIDHAGRKVKLTERKVQPYQSLVAYNGDDGNIYVLDDEGVTQVHQAGSPEFASFVTTYGEK